ncbi:MAG: PQQ-binding-like beta-propeller repeat protein [Bryobacteraceae bacterium]
MNRQLAVLLTGILASGTLSAADWPCFRGPNHNGISTEAIAWPKGGPKLLWKINVGIGHSAITVAGDRAYTMGNANETDTIYALDVATGKTIWKHSYPCNEKVGIRDYDGPFATPSVSGGVVYTLSRKGDVFALDAKTGKLIWSRNIVQEDGVKTPRFGGLAGSPLVLGGKIYLNASSGGMALDARTGKTLWKSGDGSGAYATPVPFPIGQKMHLAIHSTRELTIVDAADGKERWSTPRRQPIGVNAPDPVIDGTKVFVTAGRAFGGALFDITGDTKPLWEQEGLSSHWHTSVLLNGYLYGPNGNNSEGAGASPTSLRCLDWKTGKIQWSEPKLGFNGLIAVGGKLLILTETGDLVLAEASPSGYQELGSAHVIEGRAFTAPVFASGQAFLRNTKGDVVSVDLRSDKIVR